VRLGDGHTLALLQVDSIVADGRLEVCDGAHWAFVMKKDEVFSGYFEGLQHQRARPSGAWTGHPPDFQLKMVGCATRQERLIGGWEVTNVDSHRYRRRYLLSYMYPLTIFPGTR